MGAPRRRRRGCRGLERGAQVSRIAAPWPSRRGTSAAKPSRSIAPALTGFPAPVPRTAARPRRTVGLELRGLEAEALEALAQGQRRANRAHSGPGVAAVVVVGLGDRVIEHVADERVGWARTGEPVGAAPDAADAPGQLERKRLGVLGRRAVEVALKYDVGRGQPARAAAARRGGQSIDQRPVGHVYEAQAQQRPLDEIAAVRAGPGQPQPPRPGPAHRRDHGDGGDLVQASASRMSGNTSRCARRPTIASRWL